RGLERGIDHATGPIGDGGGLRGIPSARCNRQTGAEAELLPPGTAALRSIGAVVGARHADEGGAATGQRVVGNTLVLGVVPVERQLEIRADIPFGIEA